jgi:hypothetical protein
MKPKEERRALKKLYSQIPTFKCRPAGLYSKADAEQIVADANQHLPSNQFAEVAFPLPAP